MRSAAGKRMHMRPSPARAALATLLACIAGCLFVSEPALAEFSRPYISQITSAPTGPNGVQVPFGVLGGLTVDPLSGNVYVGFDGESFADEFNPSDEFVEQLTGVLSGSLAFDDGNGRLEGSSGVVNSRGNSVAVDNSTSPTAP